MHIQKQKIHFKTPMPTLMPSIKTLAVEMSYTEQHYIIWFRQLLRLFPCLETLYIKVSCYGWSSEPIISIYTTLSMSAQIHIKCIMIEILVYSQIVGPGLVVRSPGRGRCRNPSLASQTS